jgi:hypothetical protein
LDISEKIGDKQGIVASLNNIAVLHEQKGEYEEALSHVLEDYRIISKRNCNNFKAIIIITAGLLHQLSYPLFSNFLISPPC